MCTKISPLFTIIVPIYKVEKYLQQCIDSLLMQDFNDYEIILVDDGSPDRCPEICDSYAKLFNHIKVIHKSNGGLSDARNAGIKFATGKYITFVDSDDFWKNNDVLSGIGKIIAKYNSDIIVSDILKYHTTVNKYVYPRVVCTTEHNGRSKVDILRYLYFQHADLKMSACQKFIKRELLTRHLFTIGMLSEDIDWSLKVYPEAKSICVYDKPYYCYRQQREGSITNTASQRSFDSLIRIIEHWKNQIPQLNIPEEEKDIYMGYLVYQLSIAMNLYLVLPFGNRADSIRHIKANLALFKYPLNYKTKRVKQLVRIVGVKGTCHLLTAFTKIRYLLKK